MASIEPAAARPTTRQGLANQDQQGERERHRHDDENDAHECRPAPRIEHDRRDGKRPTCRDEPIPEQRGGHSGDHDAQSTSSGTARAMARLKS